MARASTGRLAFHTATDSGGTVIDVRPSRSVRSAVLDPVSGVNRARRPKVATSTVLAVVALLAATTYSILAWRSTRLTA